MFIAIKRRISAKENWRTVSFVIPNIAVMPPFVRFPCSTDFCLNFGRAIEKARKQPFLKRIGIVALSNPERRHTVTGLLKARHFADEEP